MGQLTTVRVEEYQAFRRASGHVHRLSPRGLRPLLVYLRAACPASHCRDALLHAGVDITVIALWLGHESTNTTHVYLHADLALKERALARTAPLNTGPGRYRPPDQLFAFLESL